MALPEYINKIDSDKRVIAWYWNSVNSQTNPVLLKGSCEKWSFDPDNCEQYGMMFNHQFYFKSLVIQESEITYDVYYCGSDSGRGRIITEFYTYLVQLGLNVKFQVVDPKFRRLPQEVISSFIPYDRIRENISHSRAILENSQKRTERCYSKDNGSFV